MKRIFIAGPYTQGDTVANVKAAIAAATELLDAGHAPFCPNICHFWNMTHPRKYDVWIKCDLAWVDSCEVMLRLPGESPGADGETARARERGIPIYYSVSSLLDDVGGRDGD